MRLPKHKLPKNVNIRERTVKHKDSDKAIARRAKKAEKKNAMMTEEPAPVDERTPEQKEADRLQRKKNNASNNAYKKNILHMTNKYGPRAVHG